MVLRTVARVHEPFNRDACLVPDVYKVGPDCDRSRHAPSYEVALSCRPKVDLDCARNGSSTTIVTISRK